MRGKVAKVLRRKIYPKDRSIRSREYLTVANTRSVVADPYRQAYQLTKAGYLSGKVRVKHG